jgi:AcrR family transcriptional regulator
MDDTRARIVTDAEHLFDRHGFAATGMDAVASAAHVSSRTLYKHVGGKGALIAAVLESRRARFVAAVALADSIDAMFDALTAWGESEGARGCLFLRAAGEGLADDPPVAASISTYRDGLRDSIRALVPPGADDLAEQLLVLFEGATAAMSYRGTAAIEAARAAAHTLAAV